ncbi:hypothetical protein WICPIJ_007971 [Wickerhamomyces pijperi]|uniref:Thioredoxin domain-containing protein n=1 Tax=Wickerhamomyces pijperi TaxID=599730 RepID=A0A9P8Q0N2_WICPI|nr:hypothetical protein WICPIJ_007971 [Wickerhamomyces pijperi]
MFRNAISRRAFSSTSRRLLQIGEEVPSTVFKHNSPGNAVVLAEQIATGRNIIVGVPGAFSPACSASHVPGYIKLVDQFKAKGIDQIFIVGVNDPFVFKAWSDAIEGSDKVTFLADPKAEFVQESELAVDATEIFGGIRSTRFALVTKDGKVEQQFAEPDHFGISISAADKVLEQL